MTSSIQNPELKTAGPFFEVQTPQQARAVLRYLPELALSSQEALTVSELARIRRASVAATSYRVKQLVQLGLLHLVNAKQPALTNPNTPAGAGRGQKYAAAPRWRIPDALLPAPTLKEFMEGYFRSKTDLFFQAYEHQLDASGKRWHLELDLTSMDTFKVVTSERESGTPPMTSNTSCG